jgi:hypothetical protein
MNKIGKKNIYVSDDIDGFKNDQLRAIINKQTEQYDCNLNEELDYVFDESFDSVNQKYRGTITIKSKNNSKNLTDIINNSKSLFLNKEIVDINFFTYKHYEKLKELSLGDDNFNKNEYFNFECLFEYNKLLEKYENFLTSNDKRIKEPNMPYYYEYVDSNFIEKISGRNLPGISKYEDRNFLNSLLGTTANTSVKALSAEFSDPYSIPSPFSTVAKVGLENYLSIFNSFKDNFPFYTEITFNTHLKEESNFYELFKDNSIINQIINAFIIDKQNYTFNNIDNSNVNKKIFLKGKIIDSNLFNSVVTITGGVNSPYIITLASLYNNLLNDKMRSMQDVMNGENNYTEVIGYLLQKFDVIKFDNDPNVGVVNARESAQPLQEWYIPNCSDEFIKIIDTQVKYNKNYLYKLNTIIMSVGNKYKYTKAGYSSTNPEIIVDYENNPDVKLFLIEDSSKFINKILSYPPMKPNMDLIPLIGSEKEVKINLSTNVGSVIEKAIPLSDKDSIYFNEVKNTQLRKSTALMFRSDDLVTKFQIFRKTTQPETLEDFSISDFLYEINLNLSKIDFISYIDTIDPKKVYYYTARVVDYHGGISNITEIYKLESVEGVLNISLFKPEEKSYNLLKPVRRYIKISPSFGQSIASKIEPNDVKLGINSDPMWNRNFKMRLVSKHTGRKIDFNFKFKTNLDKEE